MPCTKSAVLLRYFSLLGLFVLPISFRRFDPNLILLLQEFLKKEFSEENILFWQACEFFSHVPENDKKQVPDARQQFDTVWSCTDTCINALKNGGQQVWFNLFVNHPLLQLSQRAREIYNSFLSSKATTPVNIDSQAQLADDILNAPRPDMFKEQQLQVVYKPAHRMCLTWNPNTINTSVKGVFETSAKQIVLQHCSAQPCLFIDTIKFVNVHVEVGAN